MHHFAIFRWCFLSFFCNSGLSFWICTGILLSFLRPFVVMLVWDMQNECKKKAPNLGNANKIYYQENDNKWQQKKKMTRVLAKGQLRIQPPAPDEKTTRKWQKMININIQQPSEFGKIFISLNVTTSHHLSNRIWLVGKSLREILVSFRVHLVHWPRRYCRIVFVFLSEPEPSQQLRAPMSLT